ncbi:acetyl-CoA hydrolase/transferase family protein [Gottschalkiaceae bacterium SANA]|nr:acetyl-CoA hydrolase/transferase family protein [Gottschalkiaceae bacterium SANA]
MKVQEKMITVEQALSMVKSGDDVVTGLGAGEACRFMQELHSIAERVENVNIINCLPTHPANYYEEKYRNAFQVEGLFYSSELRKANNSGMATYVPNHLRLSADRWLFQRKPNIFVGVSTLPDKHGFVSLSLSTAYEKRMMEAADLVIMEINPNFPKTFGDAEVSVDDIDYLIEADYLPPYIPETQPNEKDKKVGAFIAGLVPDGACIQLGIGGIPNAVADALGTKKDLGVHTEMLTSGIMKLAKAGVITGKKKQINRGKIVAAFALGTSELYEFMDENPSIVMMDSSWVNDPYVISRNENQYSINTTLQVDLTGQCASESLGSRQFSGTGGQADTAIGAQMSRNGRSILALHSTAAIKTADGSFKVVSKIMPQLTPGAAVSLSRNDVDIIVTEYGIAELRGVSIKERVKRLIKIAHPDFRDELYKKAHEFGIIH